MLRRVVMVDEMQERTVLLYAVNSHVVCSKFDSTIAHLYLLKITDAVALGTGTKCETTVDEVKQLLRTCQIVLRDDTAHVTLWRVCYN